MGEICLSQIIYLSTHMNSSGLNGIVITLFTCLHEEFITDNYSTTKLVFGLYFKFNRTTLK